MMYTPQRMERNLRIGDAGEALFRFWFDTNCSGLDDLELHQFGYNPEGRVTDEDKSEMLKNLEESTDFALFRTEDIQDPSVEAEPILGISINTQKEHYDMEQARSPKIDYESEILEGGTWGCYSCPRGDQCWTGKTENLWFNEYNISNDYRLFKDAFGVDVVMVSILSNAPYSVNRKYRDDMFIDATREYLMEGEDALGDEDVVDFLDYLNFDQRYKNRTKPRDVEIVFLEHSNVIESIHDSSYHITGAPTQTRPRPVACIDKSEASSETDLIEFFDSMSHYTPIQKNRTWYVDHHEGIKQTGIDDCD